MIEILLILVVISTALITIIASVSRTVRYVSEMRQRTIAMNLAKEGIESIYNIRNTNRRKRSANKDQCWLKNNPRTDEGNPGCENDKRIHQGSRTLNLHQEGGSKNSYYSLEPI